MYGCWPKTTGGEGLHLMVPLDRSRDADAVLRHSRRLAQEFARSSPDRYITSAKQDRAGKLFIDYLRNGRGTTAALRRCVQNERSSGWA
jgi:bifunctional non-homologous end joining protein LigD